MTAGRIRQWLEGTRPSRRPREWAYALLLAYGVGLALHLAHANDQGAGTHGAGQPAPLWHWLRDSTLSFPLALVVALLAGVAARRIISEGALRRDGLGADLAWALPATILFALSAVPAGVVHGVLFPVPGHGEEPAFATVATQNLAVALGAGLVLLVPASRAARLRLAGPARRRALAGVLPALVVAPTALMGTGPAAAVQVAAAATPQTCGPTTANRTYDVAAVDVRIPYNRWGQGNPNGQVFVLEGDKSAVKDWDQPLGTTSSDRRLRPRPLVLRANAGECVRVNFTNELDDRTGDPNGREGLPLDPRASIQVRGVAVDVQTSGGGHVGYNEDTTVSNDPGANSITYYWSAPSEEGAHFFSDTATPAGSEGDGGSTANGLYGTFVVEPAGSTWTDPVSGNALYTGTGNQSGELYINAVIDPPTGKTFRESVQLAQDELPTTSTFGFNYGAEPAGGARDTAKCPDCVGEETSLSSWAYGDPSLVKLANGPGPWKPGTAEGEECASGQLSAMNADSCWTANVTHAYAGDPIKFRYGLAGGKETHIFHMHAHQWLAEEKDTGGVQFDQDSPGINQRPESQTIDSQTFGPMEMFTADLLFGAGSKGGTVGDSIFHCHLYPHFADGFWALFRVHDVLENGSGSTPDGIKVAALQTISGGGTPPAPTADNPGFPRFIPGKFGWRAPQPPLGITDNGAPATRYVAGRAIDETSSAVGVETAVRTRLSGGRSKPGAPFVDSCPVGAREVTFNVSAIQTNIVYNERGDHDTQGRILVLDSDVADVLAGRKNPEPLFARVNAGDCVNWNLTNRLPNWFGNDAFLKKTQTNMFGQHIHLVKFDVLASDGSSNGWNYQQAAFSRAQADFNAQIATNPASCTTTKCRLDLPANYDPRTTSAGIAPGQTIHERWYADYELRTVFSHDHHFAAVDQNRGQFGALVVEPAGFDFRDPRTGAYKQPINNATHGTVCGSACVGTAVGSAMDAIGPGADDDYRDFGLAVADFVSLTRAGGNPQLKSDVINPPAEPEEFPDEDPGVMGVNYRNAPLELRRTKNGQAVDPAYAFSSYVFGDPQTPVLQAYSEDNVRIRLIQGSQEEQHQVSINGVRWRREPDDPQSPMVNAVPVGVSEAFNFELPKISCNAGEDCRGDYLYSSGTIDDMAMGMWGILRVHGGKVPNLLPLPDNVPVKTASLPAKSGTALAPLPRLNAGNPCPTGAPLKKFSVVAMQATIKYNDAGEHDPYGLVYALAQDEAAIRAGRNPEPLVMRVNEGDCVDVTLTNKLTSAFQQHRGVVDGDAPVPAEAMVGRTPSLRVSMHPQLLKYDVRGSDGAAIGFNRDQTVAPTKSMTYRWFADDVNPGELGAANLLDYGDVRGHRHHGLFAGLVVEPRGATYLDPMTGRPLASGAIADIRVPGRADFREHVVFFADGLNIRKADGSLIDDPGGPPGEPAEPLDAEDSGEKAFNYRNEPFRTRLGYEPMANENPDGDQLSAVYDSHAHGDPATPTFRSYTGDNLVVRVLQGADKPRQHAFGLLGSSFKTQPDDPGSRKVGTLSGLTVGSAVNAWMGAANPSGDYIYGCEVSFFHRSGGLWGMSRVYPKPAAAAELQPTGVQAADDPRAANAHPLYPLELDLVKADVWNDLDRDGVHDAGEPAVAGATLRLLQSGVLKTAATSGTDGWAYLSKRAGTYALQVAPPAGYLLHKAPTSVSTAGNNATVTIKVALKK